MFFFFFFSSRRRHTRSLCDWSSDVCSSDLPAARCPLHRRAELSVLELWSAGGAFEALESYLAEELQPGLVAEVYLGYGLSQAIRRDATPAPPEPCRLPLLACHVSEPAMLGGQSPGRVRIGQWERAWTDAEYAAAVEEARAAIERGDVYQVNLVQHLSAPFGGDPGAVAARLAPLRPLHPRPLAGDGWAIVSASPELFLARRGHAAARRARRRREGRGRARHDRRPRAERPLARLRAGQRPLAGAARRARARGRRAPRLDRRGAPPR